MKISVSSYSYSNVFGKDGFDVEKMLKTVKEQGFDGIEFAGLPATEEVTDPIVYAKKLAEMSKDLGLEVSNYCAGSDFLNGSGGDIEAEIEKVKREVDISAALGVKCMRHDATGGPRRNAPPPRGFDDFVDRIAYGYRQVTEYAETLGIATTVENHGYFCQDSERVEKLINKVGHKNFGALLDVGNFLCVDENPVYAVALLAPYAKHVHVKDFYVRSGMSSHPGDGFFTSRGGNYLRGSIAGQGDAPVEQCLKIIKGSGYDGYVSLEFEGLENAVLATTIGCKNIKKMLGL